MKRINTTSLKKSELISVESNINTITETYPKPLKHEDYEMIDVRQMTAFNSIIGSGSDNQLRDSSSFIHLNSQTSSLVIKTTSVTLGDDNIPFESFISNQDRFCTTESDEEDEAPSMFHLSSVDSRIFSVLPETITCTFEETETFFIFDLPPMTGDIDTPEGLRIQENNERYENITGTIRKLSDAETQTKLIHVKPRGTYCGRKKRHNRGVLVDSWTMYDNCLEIDSHRQHFYFEMGESLKKSLQDKPYKFSPNEIPLKKLDHETQLLHLYEKSNFQNSLLTMERMIYQKDFVEAQKRFKGLIVRDPTSLDLKFTCGLELLWIHTCPLNEGRPVSSCRWNHSNSNILAVAYKGSINEKKHHKETGLLLVWCIKNPSQPERTYKFDSPISDIDWSKEKPNLLAIGFYDGSVRILDITQKTINYINRSDKSTILSCSPQWQVQWWQTDEQWNYKEQIYTSDQNGRIFCYRSLEDLIPLEIMKISRIEGEIAGVPRVSHCVMDDLLINRDPGALILRRHPNESAIYFVGSDEGNVYRCSMNYLNRHISSFLAHDGPICSMEFSPFCSKIFLTAGADWCARIWLDGLTEPLITLSTRMAYVRCATWCPTNSTVVATISENEICIWDIKKKTFRPMFCMNCSSSDLVLLQFTSNGNHLLAADVAGGVYVYTLTDMPYPPFNQKLDLIESIKKALTIKPELLRKMIKIGVKTTTFVIVFEKKQVMSELLKFRKVRSTMDPTFWAKFAELKIDKLKLDEKSIINLWASYVFQSTNQDKSNPLVLDYSSFNENVQTTNDSITVCNGLMVNTNTYEAYRQINPEEFINSFGKSLIESIKNGSAVTEPWRLSMFLLISYSDLKKYKFHYWVAHPTPLTLPEIYHESPPQSICIKFTENQVDRLSCNFLELDCKSRGFFSVFEYEDGRTSVVTLSESIEYIKTCDRLDRIVYFAFYDPCASPEPGWPLRNLLCCLFWHIPMFCFNRVIRVLSIRDKSMKNSLIFTLKTQNDKDVTTVQESIVSSPLVGWEPNINGKMGPSRADLSNIINPVTLSDKAINLNLKLMKWRLVPDLDLEKVWSLKCLLLGAGTLGCSVARVLIGWGIKNITFVDSSNVSFSNTVRQSLYTHEDAVKRRFKVDAAKDALLRIHPNLNVEGVVLQIPMPGHVVGPSLIDTTKDAVEKLEKLVENNDVVFLLLDSREARWLPTLLCAAMNKIAINAALGFDSYTVQRHGTRDSLDLPSPDLTLQNPHGQDLGCYFCNDVTQPGNSQVDRTLDQQCTVSRPGLSQIASGLAVELLIALIQHPQGIEAQALMNNVGNNQYTNQAFNGLLGGVPHTIRGSLWGYDTRLTITHRFSSCTACSIPLIKEYKENGFSFILNACNVSNYLERMSGLEEILKRPDLDELCYAIDCPSDEDEEENSTNKSLLDNH